MIAVWVGNACGLGNMFLSDLLLPLAATSANVRVQIYLARPEKDAIQPRDDPVDVALCVTVGGLKFRRARGSTALTGIALLGIGSQPAPAGKHG